LLVGCGGDDSGGGNVAVDNLGTELASVSCSKQFECCSDAEIMDLYMGITINDHPIATEADCNEFSNALLSGLLVPEYKESLAAGRIEYDGTAAADCIADIQSLSCDQYNSGDIDSVLPTCRPFVIPKVGDGGACGEDYECTSGFCDGETEDGPDGMCKPKPGAGEACTDDCADGLYCGFDTSGGGEMCMPKLANGETCNLDDRCMSDYCADGGMCAEKPPLCQGS